jgi:prepilin-type processing-associated H-X9-DG protein
MAQPEDDRQDQAKNRRLIGRWDLVALLLLAVIVIGMLLPGIQRIRGPGNRMACLNNLRQIGLALQSANVANNRLPPFFGTYSGKPNSGAADKACGVYPATIFFHLLPHLEQPGTYQRLPPLFNYPAPDQYVLAPSPPIVGQGIADENAAAFKVPSLICPSDTSGDPSGVNVLTLTPGKVPASKWGASGYAANYLLFGLVKEPRLPEPVPDGLSNTIFFTEKAAICADAASGRLGGNLWAVPAFFPSDPQARINYGGSVGYDPADANPTKPYSVTLFQVTPAVGQCDPTLAQSPHNSGMNVSMGDGSARYIAGNVSPKTWSALLTPYPIEGISFPAGGKRVSDEPGADWN